MGRRLVFSQLMGVSWSNMIWVCRVYEGGDQIRSWVGVSRASVLRAWSISGKGARFPGGDRVLFLHDPFLGAFNHFIP